MFSQYLGTRFASKREHKSCDMTRRDVVDVHMTEGVKRTTVLAWIGQCDAFAFSVGGAAYTYALCMQRASTPAAYGCA